VVDGSHPLATTITCFVSTNPPRRLNHNAGWSYCRTEKFDPTRPAFFS
jgi:hypothetical protein